MTLENDFLQLEASRRSVYTLGKKRHINRSTIG